MENVRDHVFMTVKRNQMLSCTRKIHAKPQNHYEIKTAMRDTSGLFQTPPSSRGYRRKRKDSIKRHEDIFLNENAEKWATRQK